MLHWGEVTVNHHSIPVGLSCVKTSFPLCEEDLAVKQIRSTSSPPTTSDASLREGFQLLNAPTDAFVFKQFLSTAKEISHYNDRMRFTYTTGLMYKITFFS